MEMFFISNENEKFNNVMQIRNTVFELEQGAIEEEELDIYDKLENTLYLLIYDGDKPCATGRIAKTDRGFKIGRIAVVKSQRGRGTGRILVDTLCKKAHELGAEKLYVDAQLHAVEFYQKLGFIPTGENEITDRGIRHLPMVRNYE